MRRVIFKLIILIKNNSSFCCVRDHIFDLWIRRTVQNHLPVLMAVQATANRRHDLGNLFDLSIFKTPQKNRIATILSIQLLRF